jgi:hypothetical protein
MPGFQGEVDKELSSDIVVDDNNIPYGQVAARYAHNAVSAFSSCHERNGS